MRIRKTNAIIGVSLAVGALFMIYLVFDTVNNGYEDPELLQVFCKYPLVINPVIKDR